MPCNIQKQGVCCRGIAREQPAGRLHSEGQACQLWPQSIVQIAPESAPLFLTSGDQPLAGPLEVGSKVESILVQPHCALVERHRTRGHPGVTGKVRQQTSITGRESAGTGAR